MKCGLSYSHDAMLDEHRYPSILADEHSYTYLESEMRVVFLPLPILLQWAEYAATRGVNSEFRVQSWGMENLLNDSAL